MLGWRGSPGRYFTPEKGWGSGKVRLRMGTQLVRWNRCFSEYKGRIPERQTQAPTAEQREPRTVHSGRQGRDSPAHPPAGDQSVRLYFELTSYLSTIFFKRTGKDDLE